VTLLALIRELVAEGGVVVSRHGFRELAADAISLQDIIEGLAQAKIVEEYPEYFKGPAILLLQWDREGEPVHILWGVPKGRRQPAVLVTAYRPKPEKWESDFVGRRTP
jgi:hypothetical protein